MAWFEERFTPAENRHPKQCSECSRTYWLPRSKLEQYQTCGGECSAIRRKRLLDERRRPCETCGEQFLPRTTQLAVGAGRFCSQRCNTASHAAMNTPTAQATSQAAWLAKFKAFPFIHCGPSNPKWTGGRPATYMRRKDAGCYREENHTRRLRGKGPVEPGTAIRLGTAQRWRCAACRCDIRRSFHLDHVLPLALGGTNSRLNFQPLCPPCNRSKHAKHPVDFMQSRGFLL